MKSVNLVFILVFSGLVILGQDTSYYFQQKDFFKQGIITLNDQQEYKVKDLEIGIDSVSFMHRESKLIEKVAIADIQKLQFKKGTRAVGGAIIGAAIPFIFILESLLDNEPNPPNTGLRVLAIVGTGALICGAIGYSIPVWETYKFENNQPYGLSIDYRIKVNSRMIGAGIVLRF